MMRHSCYVVERGGHVMLEKGKEQAVGAATSCVRKWLPKQNYRMQYGPS